ncbi:MAG: glycoside hydrolase family 95 protein, partial [Armatimonadetes bacterium]|nr:glycoside hydrolase family 95 protein [Armatimonadota bacterium]
HPPFQIDGNFGALAGILEMIVQDHDGAIEFLPALPSAWPTGSLKGVRARGGVELDIEWKDGELTEVRVRSDKDGRVTVRYRGKDREVDVRAGRDTVLTDLG